MAYFQNCSRFFWLNFFRDLLNEYRFNRTHRATLTWHEAIMVQYMYAICLITIGLRPTQSLLWLGRAEEIWGQRRAWLVLFIVAASLWTEICRLDYALNWLRLLELFFVLVVGDRLKVEVLFWVYNYWVDARWLDLSIFRPITIGDLYKVVRWWNKDSLFILRVLILSIS
jgi:hypothetical protein